MEGPAMAILEVRGLGKYYGRRKVVDGVDFDVDVGEVVGLLGPNGAGKTTSFRMATGQITPNEGKVIFNGNDVTQLPMYRRARLGMGYLSQETSVFRKLTVEQNILAILEALHVHRTLGRKLMRAERHEHTDRVLDKFGLTHLKKNNAARLSGGEKRRLEIARCLVCDPLLILLDEPFTGIDPPTIADIKGIIRDLRNHGIGILVTDHQVREILSITDRSYLIKQGKVFVHGTPQEIVKNEEAIKAYIGHTAEGLTFENHAAQKAPAAPQSRSNLQRALEQDKLQGLLEKLRSHEFQVAAAELVRIGPAVAPLLVGALEWRDVEMRRRVLDVLQRLLGAPVAFDPYAPEQQRVQQLSAIRSRLERKAG
jgi:lipopolysaccharide export system ATP-binding protein